LLDFDMKPHVLIFSGYGLNCEDETAYAFERAGASAEIVHINDLIERPSILTRYQIAAFPGGFSYGDDMGSGKAFGLRLKNHLGREIESFLKKDTLMIGICNGFQILTAAGILPGALLDNASARYVNRWVDVRVVGESPWLHGLDTLSLPIAHGEGRYYISPDELQQMKKNRHIALTYVQGEISQHFDLPENPNGSLENIAGIVGHGGRVLGLMPHPERAQFFTQLPHWTFCKEKITRSGMPLPEEGPGLSLFRNAVRYFS
jgi:phosphoribosylformylglycinamidine synthase